MQDFGAMVFSANYGIGGNWTAQRTSDVPAEKVLIGGAAATPKQFRGMVTYGALVSPRTTAPGVTTPSLQANANYSQNARQLNLPRVEVKGAVTLVLRSAIVGGPTFGRLTSFNFASIIPPPSADERGHLLTGPNSYWAPEPYTTVNHSNAPYYWSIHAQQVFATQPGPIQITWRAAAPATITGTNKVTIGGLDYATTNVNYVISGAAVKKPRQLYWTEKSFRSTGKPVTVPTARIGAVYFHYNSAFPRTVSTEYQAVGASSVTDGSTNAVLQELRTAWFDSGQNLILAYNKEGRVFLELLGDPTLGGARKHLGYEILDVLQQPSARDLTVNVGDIITAYADGRADTDLLPAPVVTDVGASFLYHDTVGTNGRDDYYAVKETSNQNDVLVHWLETGVAGLRWPLLFDRYQQVWPSSPAYYSQYIRVAAGSPAEAARTFVQLPADNVPVLQYQDPLDQPRAFLDEQSRFYTWLDAGQPAHRALLRYISGSRVAFERVLSVLDSSLKGSLLNHLSYRVYINGPSGNPADSGAFDTYIASSTLAASGSLRLSTNSVFQNGGGEIGRAHV